MHRRNSHSRVGRQFFSQARDEHIHAAAHEDALVGPDFPEDAFPFEELAGVASAASGQ